LFSDKELIFKRTDPITKSVTRTNAYLTSAANLHKVQPKTLYPCISSKDIGNLTEAGQPTVKRGIVTMPFGELVCREVGCEEDALTKKGLQILNTSDAILTTQSSPENVRRFFQQLVALYKSDSEKEGDARKYENILDTVIYFVSEEDFKRCTQPVAVKEVKRAPGTSKLAQFLADMKEWGGLDDDILHDLKKEDINDIGKVMA
jgi:hypothetical protein